LGNIIMMRLPPVLSGAASTRGGSLRNPKVVCRQIPKVKLPLIIFCYFKKSATSS
jgi:hypothetical protein